MPIALVPFVPGTTVLQAGGYYALPEGQPVSIKVEVPHVTFVGGHVWPKGGEPAIDVLAEGCTILRAFFHKPDAPVAAGDKPKIGIGPCVRTRAKGTAVIRCRTGTIDTFINAMGAAAETLIAWGDTGEDLRAYAFFNGGADKSVILFSDFRGSHNENVTRWSPDNQKIGEGAVIAFNRISNPIKACLDQRQVVGSFVGWNVLTSNIRMNADGTSQAGTAYSCGPGGKTGINVPNDAEKAGDVYFAHNQLFAGKARIEPGASNVYYVGNVGRKMEVMRKGQNNTRVQKADSLVYIEGKSEIPTMRIKGVHIDGNVLKTNADAPPGGPVQINRPPTGSVVGDIEESGNRVEAQ
jgi:hypothetical protein